ncbi:MAG TPA: MFS transporter [Leadbetterella sp.]|nr:MFS transporter [Leadbetterella sp.]
MKNEKSDLQHLFSMPVIVAALGYFVDIYDLQLFGIVRIPSLESLGLNKQEVDTIGTSIINIQMIGLLIGGILWGTLGDKKGRLSVLFGSIITYSLANIFCGFIPQMDFVDKVEAYKWLRFLAGIGLAGELGAGITLVSEALPKHLRAKGTSLVAGVGLLGAVVATFTVKLSGNWTIAYFIGGGMGFLLLLLRVGVLESGMYKSITDKAHVSKGNFFAFFTDWNRFTKYLRCIGIGMPTWFCIGILVYLSNQFGETFGFTEKVEPGLAIMWAYVGISAGDFLSGFLSHWLASRKKAIAFMMGMSLLGVLFYLFGGMQSAFALYATCVWLGFWTGYWAMFVTVGAEQFGTNLRATAATTVPNMVRGSVAGMTTLFGFWKPNFGVIWAAAAVGLIIYIIGFYSTLSIAETHDKDLDYLEN